MRNLDLSSWPALLSTLLGLAVITLIGVGIRLLVMQTVQTRRERENRQINERLRTLIAAYKTLGGSFTGDLTVNPAHLRDLQRGVDHPVDPAAEVADAGAAATVASSVDAWPGSDRSRRIRDAVEAALSDIILLGTEEQVQLAAKAATELAEGRPAHTAELVICLRDFIRQVLDLDPVPTHLSIPRQGPARPTAKRGGGSGDTGEKDSSKQGSSKGAGAGASAGTGLGGSFPTDDESDHHH
jgi:type II secretory pathway pseudopilin PulG